MKSLWNLAALPAASLVIWSFATPHGAAQEPGPRRLAPAGQSAAQATEPGQREAEFDADTWRASLRDADLDRREAAFDRVIEAARRDPAARRALERWSWEQGDRELAWTARLALRELDRPDPVGGLLDPGRPLDVREFERLFSRAPFGVDPLGGGALRKMEDWLEDIRRMPHPGQRQSSSSVSVRHTPNGVTIELTEDGQTRTYEGPSAEEILRAHPELSDTLSIGPGGMLRVRSGSAAGAFDERLQRLFEDLEGRPLVDPWGRTPLAAPRTDVLGVRVDSDAGSYGQPLVVRSIETNSLAERLGVRVGDELVDLNGTRILSRSDLARVLSERAAGEELGLTVIRADGSQDVLRYTPED
jgi:hypothetical protein